MKCITLLSVILFFYSCGNEDGYHKAEDAEDAGREFIRASLDGNYEKAKFYLYRDSADLNLRLLNKWKQDYDQLEAADKRAYKEASIRPVEIKPLDDSTAWSYSYFNSYKKDTTTIKVVRANGEWLVDLSDIH